MSLLGREKALIKNDYFQVWEIVEMLSKEGYHSWEEVGQFLGHYDFDTELTLYKQDAYCRINEVHNNYLPIRKLIDGLGMVWLEGEESIQKIKIDIIGYYWAKHEIFNFKPIMDLGIIEGFNEQITEPLYKKPTQANTEFEKINASLELDLAIEKTKVEKLNEEISHLKAHIAELESKKMQYPQKENAINDEKINIANSDLLLISALMTTLRSEIKVKGKSSQAKILERIEDEHRSIKGLSKSRTEKVLASANSLYKALINNQMK